MARTLKAWTFRVKPGRHEEAMALFREANTGGNDGPECSLLYADSAGEYSGTFTFVAAFPSAEAAGRDHDAMVKELMEDGAQAALWRKFHSADSPLEPVGTAIYIDAEL